MKKYTLELLEKIFNEDKKEFIEFYATYPYSVNFTKYQYTKGNIVLIANDKAYSLDGFFHTVVLKDENFLNNLNEVALLDGKVEF